MRDLRAELTQLRSDFDEIMANLIKARTRTIEAIEIWRDVRDRANNLAGYGVEHIPVRAAHHLDQLAAQLAELDSRRVGLVKTHRRLDEIERQIVAESN
jgi:hypothetical protein